MLSWIWTYPGVNTLFDSPVRSDGSQKWVDFASSFWHADCVRSIGLKSFTERYCKWCKRNGYNFQPLKPKEIFETSKDLITVFPKNSMSKTLIKQAIAQLNSVSATVEHIRAEMNALASQLPEYQVVMAMCGVGTSLGPQLMAEIGDISRFPRHETLLHLQVLTPVLINPVHMRHEVYTLLSVALQDFVKLCFKLWIV